MSQSWQLRFRAILTGLVLADLVGAEPSLIGLPALEQPSREPCHQLWRQLLIQTAQAAGQGRLPSWQNEIPNGLAALQTAEVETPLLLSLSALPLMLFQIDVGQGKAALAAWSEQQGLQPQTQALMQAVFRLLQRGLRAGSLDSRPRFPQNFSGRTGEKPDERTVDPDLGWLAASADGQFFDGEGGEPSSAWGSLANSLAITQQAQGQYELALRLALRLPKPAGEVPLVGLWAAVAGGLSAIPLRWRLEMLYGSRAQAALQQRWAIAQEESLWQLTDTLFNRWIGVCPSLISEASSVYPVGQVSSRLNRAN